jgi:hypothetical protein
VLIAAFVFSRAGQRGVFDTFREEEPVTWSTRSPVSKRVNSSKADADDATLIEPVEVTVA